MRPWDRQPCLSELIARATEPGSFAIEVGEMVFKWRTPLGALLHPRVCPVDGEPMKGEWSYCPFHGNELVARPAEASGRP